MSVIYPTSVINSRLQDVVTAIDAGGSNGFLRLLDVGGNTLSSLELARPCGTVSGGVITFSGMSLIDPAAAAAGIATAARVDTSAGSNVITGLTVGTPGASTFDIYITPSNAIAVGQTVAITQATITGH